MIIHSLLPLPKRELQAEKEAKEKARQERIKARKNKRGMER